MAADWSLTQNTSWREYKTLPSESYRCGYCGKDVSSHIGWVTDGLTASIRLCPQCNAPTFLIRDGRQFPGPLPGRGVSKLGENVESLYKEARASFSVQAYTGAVMLCRKILMNVSVQKGAKERLPFVQYVEWLVKEGYVPKGSEGWLEYIKDRGNEANHVIVPMTKEDAEGLLTLTEQLLRNMFELPGLVPTVTEAQAVEAEAE